MSTDAPYGGAASDRETHFAPPARADSVDLLAGYLLCLENPIVKAVLESLSGYVLVLNEQRQILAGNLEVREALERENDACIVGLRPGELFNCLHFTAGPDGCGTSLHCRSCGAVLTILASQARVEPATGECRLSMLHDGNLMAIDFKVRATPISVAERSLTVCVFQDISALKRREILEQVLLHDIANSITGIEGWTTLLKRDDPQVVAEQILTLSNQLRGEVEFHRALLRAEKNELVKKLHVLEAADVLHQVEGFFKRHRLVKDRHLVIEPVCGPGTLNSDPKLLHRILVNMVKNALEATDPGGSVHICFAWDGGRPGFYVHNDGLIPEDQHAHIFERSFSTRGAGRGIGTYSMKLFGENCLGGCVGFTSTEANGTEFSILLPQDDQENLPDESRVTRRPQPATDAGLKLLLVDDEENHARLSTLLLERLGFQVHACSSGAEAEQVFGRDPRGFAALLTDYRMPGMDGIELAQRIHAIRADLPILLCTGIEEQAIAPLAKGTGVTKISTKPTARQEFARLLAEIGIPI